MKDGKKHGLCAFRLNSGETILTYYYMNMPIAFEATIFYPNGESCSVMNENGFKGNSQDGSTLQFKAYDTPNVSSSNLPLQAWYYDQNLNNFGINYQMKYLELSWFLNEVFRAPNGVYRWPGQNGMFKGKIKDGKPNGHGK
jgi:hypothetical protein